MTTDKQKHNPNIIWKGRALMNVYADAIRKPLFGFGFIRSCSILSFISGCDVVYNNEQSHSVETYFNKLSRRSFFLYITIYLWWCSCWRAILSVQLFPTIRQTLLIWPPYKHHLFIRAIELEINTGRQKIVLGKWL